MLFNQLDKRSSIYYVNGLNMQVWQHMGISRSLCVPSVVLWIVLGAQTTFRRHVGRRHSAL